MSEFTVCALLYGGVEYWPLHQRCLESLTYLPRERCGLRLALNAVTNPQVLELVAELEDSGAYVIQGENCPKYRRMRELLDARPLAAYTMWFDDDSRLDRRLPSYVNRWLDDIGYVLKTGGMLGHIYRIGWRPGQQDWVRAQPWYQQVDLDDKARFITGGWWTIRSELLLRYGWPWPELGHNGGDVMLGVCLQQHGHKLVQFHEGVAINAAINGQEGSAKRRGLSEPPIGSQS